MTDSITSEISHPLAKLVGLTGSFVSTWGERCRCTVTGFGGSDVLVVDYLSCNPGGGGQTVETLVRGAYLHSASEFIPDQKKESITPAS
jgi:hypothetical protein